MSFKLRTGHLNVLEKLLEIGEGGAISKSDLAKRCRASHTYLNPILKELEQHGLILVKHFGGRPFYLISANLNHYLVKALQKFYSEE